MMADEAKIPESNILPHFMTSDARECGGMSSLKERDEGLLGFCKPLPVRRQRRQQYGNNAIFTVNHDIADTMFMS